jgi:UDP-2,3-diacylglucosamine pyrophosphatase LpxH
LSAWAKLKVKNAVSVISKFEEALVHEAGRQEVQGVICGHIHHATSRRIDGVHYLNTGDWVESCTAIVEHMDGRMEIIHWMERGGVDRTNAAAEPRDEEEMPAARLPLAARQAA